MVAVQSDEMTLPAVVKTRESGVPGKARGPRTAAFDVLGWKSGFGLLVWSLHGMRTI